MRVDTRVDPYEWVAYVRPGVALAAFVHSDVSHGTLRADTRVRPYEEGAPGLGTIRRDSNPVQSAQASSTSGLMMLSGRSPLSTATRFRAAIVAIFVRASTVAEAICGATMQFGR